MYFILTIFWQCQRTKMFINFSCFRTRFNSDSEGETLSNRQKQGKVHHSVNDESKWLKISVSSLNKSRWNEGRLNAAEIEITFRYSLEPTPERCIPDARLRGLEISYSERRVSIYMYFRSMAFGLPSLRSCFVQTRFVESQ